MSDGVVGVAVFTGHRILFSDKMRTCDVGATYPELDYSCERHSRTYFICVFPSLLRGHNFVYPYTPSKYKILLNLLTSYLHYSTKLIARNDTRCYL